MVETGKPGKTQGHKREGESRNAKEIQRMKKKKTQRFKRIVRSKRVKRGDAYRQQGTRKKRHPFKGYSQAPDTLGTENLGAGL